MSGVAIVRHLLANSSPLTSAVPATRIQAGVLPLGTPIPAISVTQIAGQQHNNLAMASAQYLVTQRIQVTVLAATYPLVKAALALIRAALPLSRGTINGFTCDAVLPDIEGPDLYDNELKVHVNSVDYMVTFHR